MTRVIIFLLQFENKHFKYYRYFLKSLCSFLSLSLYIYHLSHAFFPILRDVNLRNVIYSFSAN